MPILLLLLLITAGCRVAEAQLLEPNFTPASGPAPPPSPAPTQPTRPPPPSWTDERVVAELEKNCAFDPDKLTSDERAGWLEPGMPNALSCQGSFDQSCVYDPCYIDEQRHCKPRCTSQCKSCGATCAATCETCKSACKPPGGATNKNGAPAPASAPDQDACRLRCATACGVCHQTCVRTRDRCATGTCTAEYRACRSKLKTEWQNNGCAEVCRAYLSCQKPCLRKHEKKGDGWEACTKPCYPPKDQRHGCDLLLCPGEFGMGINPADWRGR